MGSVIKDVERELYALLRKSWKLYWKFEDRLVPSIPILFFGDHRGYLNSRKLKIITVGLNPSRNEFHDGFERFQEAKPLCKKTRDSMMSLQDLRCHLNALNHYFKTGNEYAWFKHWEPVLKGLNCSYYDGQPNTALHTDFCTPLATQESWCKLDADQKRALKLDGSKLWRCLIKCLQPNIILVSIRHQYRNQMHNSTDGGELKFSWDGEWERISTMKQKDQNPYELMKRHLVLNESKQSLVVFGKGGRKGAGRKPCDGLVSDQDKTKMGECIKKYYMSHVR